MEGNRSPERVPQEPIAREIELTENTRVEEGIIGEVNLVDVPLGGVVFEINSGPGIGMFGERMQGSLDSW